MNDWLKQIQGWLNKAGLYITNSGNASMRSAEALPSGAKKVLDKVGDGVHNAMNTPLTVTMMSGNLYSPVYTGTTDKKPMTYLSTPKLEALLVMTMTAAPALAVSAGTVGVPATVGGLVGGAATGYVGKKAGEGAALMLGLNKNTLEMLGTAGEFAGMGVGAKIGSIIGKYTIGPDGKIFNSKIIQRPDYFYRTVGMDAIEDANATGIIRGNPATGDGPYFQTDINPQRRLLRAPINNVNKNKNTKRAVIEGRPESAEAWVDSWRVSRRKYIEDQVKLAANFGDDSEFAFWHELYSQPIKDIRKPIIEDIDALPYLNKNKQTLLEFGTEAFPMTLGKFEAPSSNFIYYREFPLIGWRGFKFKQKIPR